MAASRRSDSSASRSSPRGGDPGRSHVEEVELGRQALGRAPGAADQALRRLTRAHQRQHPLGHRLRRLAEQRLLAGAQRLPGVTRRLASTSSATWRSATSRSADRFSTRKKLLSAVGTRSCGYTRPSRSRWISASGVRSTSTTSSAVASTWSGNVSRTRTPVSSATWSLRLSRCWTLTVEKTSMPASSTSSMSW